MLLVSLVCRCQCPKVLPDESILEYHLRALSYQEELPADVVGYGQQITQDVWDADRFVHGCLTRWL
jgi:hypothetical protein